MQYTKVGGGGDGRWGKEMKNEGLGGKNEKGERKREEKYLKNGEKGIKNASFWVINFRRGVFR